MGWVSEEHRPKPFQADPFPPEKRSGVRRSFTVDDIGEHVQRVEAKVDRCITSTEIAVRHAERAADAAETTRSHLGTLRGIAQRQANDMASLRHGIPASWIGRVGLVAIAAIIGAVSAIVVVACGHPVVIP